MVQYAFHVVNIISNKGRIRMGEPMITDLAYFYCTEEKKEVDCEDRCCDKFALAKNSYTTDRYPKWECFDCAKVTLKQREGLEEAKKRGKPPFSNFFF